MPVSVDSFKKVFGGDDVLLLPCFVEFRSHDLHIVFEFNFVLLVFEKEPNENKFLIEIFSRFQNFNPCSLFCFQVLHIENVGNKGIGHLPRRVDLDEIGDIIINRR